MAESPRINISPAAPPWEDSEGEALEPGAQPLPTRAPGAGETDIQTLVMRDIEARRDHGVRVYGQALFPFNGRDMLWDAYEEALDLAIYLRGLYEEEQQVKRAQAQAEAGFEAEQLRERED